MGRALENALAVLNGLVGDHLARTENGLETRMTLVRDGKPVVLDAASLAQIPGLGRDETAGAGARIVILVHGLMNTEAIWELPDGGDYGTYLARDLGFVPFHVRYNTGLPIVDNGAALAQLLDALVAACALVPCPIEEILLIGYSMGGLVVRSACHVGALGERPFIPLVKRAIYVGTPHLGAPYERAGRIVTAVLGAINDPYTQLVADIANLRSAGLQDLGDADLRHEDRERRSGALHLGSFRHPVPLLPGMKHYLIAGSLSDARWLRELFGDALVPVSSALAVSREAVKDLITETHVLSRRSHIALAHDPDVYERIRTWAALP